MRFDDGRPMGQIVGVVKDFHLSSLREAVWPLVMHVMPLTDHNFVSIRVSPGPIDQTLAHVQSVWHQVSPLYPFDYFFLDNDFERLHRADTRLGNVFGSFSLIAILVACLGLFGLASYTAERRTKEIGIRKVLGASLPSLLSLLSKDFLKLVVLSTLIASPLASLRSSHCLPSASRPFEPPWPTR
jgi:putative ABC transport system permease protein